MIVVVPAVSGVMIPLALTLAMPGLVDNHVTVLFVAFAGVKIGVIVSVFPPAVMESDFLLISKPVSATGAGFTVTWQNATFPPSTEVATMVVVPAAIGVTLPLLSTVAIVELLEPQAIRLSVALLGVNIGESTSACAPAVIVRTVLFRVRPVTDMVSDVAVVLSADA